VGRESIGMYFRKVGSPQPAAASNSRVVLNVAVAFRGVCIVSDTIYDVRQEQYPTVIREMIRHEDNVTNHRIMWLLVGEGFIANAYVSVKSASAPTYSLLSVVGILISLSAFVMLYQSYQARGYLEFLGQKAKHGTLQEGYLPLLGWPRSRIKGWWRNLWVYPWLRRTRDLMEPWLLMPYLFASLWTGLVLRVASPLNMVALLILSVTLSGLIFAMSCIALVWSQSKDDSTEE
jgi:hypothetical protein